jgi:hypothetical protein
MSQRGHIVRPDGTRKTWAIVDRDGRGKLQWEGKFKTKGDAQRRLNAALGETESGADTLPRSTTFEQFARAWLPSRKLLRGGTEAGYASLINNQLIPHLGKIRVTRLRFEHAEAALSGMVEDQLAPKTIHNTVMLLRTVL